MIPTVENMLANKSAGWLFETVSDAMFVADPGGHILLGNAAAERLFGYAPDEFVGLVVEDLIPRRLQTPVGKRGHAVLSMPTMMDSGRGTVALRKDGSEFSADVSLSALEDGKILAVVHDFTLCKEALTAAQEFTESLVAALQEPLVVLDAEERVFSANRVFYQVFQVTEQEALGRPFFELNDKQWDIPVLRELLAEELPKVCRIEAFELQHDFPGIGSRTVLIRALQIEDKLNQPKLTVLSFLNITERRRLEAERIRMIQELESANEELNNFAYVVSHDLKAPLRAIGSLAEWITADQEDKLDAQGREHLRLLGQRVRRMSSLIDGILRYSRIGQLRETAVLVDINELVREAIGLLDLPGHIALTVAPGLPSVRVEKTAVQQVFQNLIGNAIRYLDKPQGHIEIGCTCHGENWRFSVTDNGPGIEARHFERIFQLFQTLNPRDRVESTGVGLAIVKKIVEQCGGGVGVESVPGQGSTFFFTLPKTTV